MINHRYNLLLGVLGIIGAALILIATRSYGALLSPDSVQYILAARQIADAPKAFAVSNTFKSWPPLYPAVLAGIDQLFGRDALVLAPYLNAALFGFIVYLGGLLMFRQVRIPLLAVLGALAILASTTLLKVSLAVWSEPLFICLVLLFLLAFGSYQTQPGLVWLGVMGIAVALACLTRYIGFILIPTGATMILFLHGGTRRPRLSHAAAFVLIAGFPIGLWLTRNFVVSGTLSGNRGPSAFSFIQNLNLTLDTLLVWFVPPGIAAQRGLGVLWMGALVLIAVFALRGSTTWRSTLWTQQGANLLLIVSYLGFLILSATTVAYDQIDFRLLSPLFIPILLVVFFILGEISESLQARMPGRAIALLFATGIGIWLVYPIQGMTVSIGQHMNEGGLGYNNKAWRESETIQYLRAHPELASECQFTSNGYDAIYILTNLDATLSPSRSAGSLAEAVNRGGTGASRWPGEGKHCLIWLDLIQRDYLMTVPELGEIATVKLLLSFQDGALYSIAQK
jgi:4-amino-4-deoxy-L-arabinose transferase-like glycosyltransferase